MPIYEYQCEKCKFIVERLQIIGANSPCCPNCGGAMLKKCGSIAMVKWNGEGGFPSMRKVYKGGTAPYTRGYDQVPGD